MLNARNVAKALTPVVNEWLLVKLKLEAISERIDAMDREILQANDFRYAERWAKNGREKYVGRVLDPELTYLMDEDDSAKYFEIRDDRIAADGWDVPERGYCPKCMADSEMVEMNHKLIAEAGKHIPGVTADKLLCAGMDKYREFIDLCVKLVVNAPGYQEPKLDLSKFPRALARAEA